MALHSLTTAPERPTAPLHVVKPNPNPNPALTVPPGVDAADTLSAAMFNYIRRKPGERYADIAAALHCDTDFTHRLIVGFCASGLCHMQAPGNGRQSGRVYPSASDAGVLPDAGDDRVLRYIEARPGKIAIAISEGLGVSHKSLLDVLANMCHDGRLEVRNHRGARGYHSTGKPARVVEILPPDKKRTQKTDAEVLEFVAQHGGLGVTDLIKALHTPYLHTQRQLTRFRDAGELQYVAVGRNKILVFIAGIEPIIPPPPLTTMQKKVKRFVVGAPGASVAIIAHDLKHARATVQKHLDILVSAAHLVAYIENSRTFYYTPEQNPDESPPILRRKMGALAITGRATRSTKTTTAAAAAAETDKARLLRDVRRNAGRGMQDVLDGLGLARTRGRRLLNAMEKDGAIYFRRDRDNTKHVYPVGYKKHFGVLRDMHRAGAIQLSVNILWGK